LAVADESSELARAVREGQFGLVVEPGNAESLLAAATEMLNASPERLATWARNGTAWVDQFRRTHVLSSFENRIAELVKERKRGGS
jgi:colanic acid biosynthesis glycosyl transferase WcaI